MAPTEGTDATLRGFCGYAMKRAFLGVQADLNRVLAAYGLRMMTFSALVVIVDNPGLRQAQLSDALAVERPNMVALVAELVKAGLITRNPAPDDRRAQALEPTDRGRALCAEAIAAVETHEAQLTRDLDETELRALMRALALVERAATEEETRNA
ncbi:MarR family winged helix-turn-helix transcriptional regulator [Seohaeicola zhoushanensis]|uniref:Hydroxycinnamic acid degradation regulator n=1 Tax=Seohaeicola zhoushanensis TaxID=1569283 RepID=A0A8J3GTX2_9RHOB|nr:MarR family transcriptional regulator [Seohaeicola zhoushanensis]GHF33507.1 hydroxycinnamic acid degradation regulator [Seohaeicola zhoushanensis]